MKETFSIKEAFKTGWEIFKGQSWFMVGLMLLMALLYSIPSVIVEYIANPFVYTFASIALGLFQTVLGMSVIYITLAVYDKKEVSYMDWHKPLSQFIPYLGMIIVSLLIIIGGSVLFIVPGIIASIALTFPAYLLIDKKMGAMESIRVSWAMTKGYRLQLVLLGLVATLFNVLGLIALGVGLLITIPVTMLVAVHVYRTLFAQADANGVLPVKDLQTAPRVFIGIAIAAMVVLAGVVGLGYKYTQDNPELLQAMQQLEAMEDADFENFTEDDFKALLEGGGINLDEVININDDQE